MECKQRECPHFKETDCYKFCKLANLEILRSDDCVAIAYKERLLSVWGDTLKKASNKIEAMRDLESN